MAEDKFPMEALARLAREATGTLAVQVCRYRSRTATLWTVALDADEKILRLAEGSHRAPCVAGHAIMTDIYHHGREYRGPLDVLYQGVLEAETAERLIAESGCRHALILPVMVEGRVWGALCVFHDQPLTTDQCTQARQVGAMLENMAEQSGRAEIEQRRMRLARRFGVVLADAEERVRQEIAEELHTRVQTKLLLVWHELRACLTAAGALGDLASKLEHLATTVDTIREEDVRRISHRLHPSAIRVALRPAVGQLAASFRGVMAVEVTADSEFIELDHPLESQIPDRIRMTTYRVIEEALLNAARHGKARQAVVHLSGQKKSLTVSIQDDGHGFDTEITPWGLGLTLMAERLEEVGGRLDVSSVPHFGTRLRASIILRGVRRVKETRSQMKSVQP